MSADLPPRYLRFIVRGFAESRLVASSTISSWRITASCAMGVVRNRCSSTPARLHRRAGGKLFINVIGCDIELAWPDRRTALGVDPHPSKFRRALEPPTKYSAAGDIRKVHLALDAILKSDPEEELGSSLNGRNSV
jgi:hypothetical protein